MAREMIDDTNVEQVTGGSIVFNGDHTTCGRNCNNQYKVNDYNAVQKYIRENCTKMSEKSMINNMVSQGLLSSL